VTLVSPPSELKKMDYFWCFLLFGGDYYMFILAIVVALFCYENN